MTKYGWRNNSLKAKDTEVTKLTVTGKMPVQYIIPKTVAVSTSAIITGEDINANGTSAYTSTSFLLQPPYPMQLHLNWNAAGSAGDSDTLVFAGEDAMGETISETLTITSAASGNAYTTRAFARLGTVTPGAVSACTDIGIGWRKNIGLPWPLAAAADVISYNYDGGYSSTQAQSGLTIVSTTYGVLTLPTMAASKVVSVLYLSTVQKEVQLH